MAKRNFPEHPFDVFLTARCCNKDWFRQPLDEIWNIFGCCLHLVSSHWQFEIRAFVLMANHYHLLVTTNREALPAAMNYLQRETAREINHGSKRINHVWGRPYHATVITCRSHWMNAFKYLYRNPVKAGVCAAVEEYRYSTLRMQLGFEHAFVPVRDNPVQNDMEGTLRWLNTAPQIANYDLQMKRALSRGEMAFGKTKNSVPSRFDTEVF